MRPDPGGDFASDEHRRVMAAVPNADDPRRSAEEIMERVNADDFLHLDESELEEILKDLEADGHASSAKAGWKNTKAGFELLTGPPAEERNDD